MVVAPEEALGLQRAERCQAQGTGFGSWCQFLLVEGQAAVPGQSGDTPRFVCHDKKERKKEKGNLLTGEGVK